MLAIVLLTAQLRWLVPRPGVVVTAPRWIRRIWSQEKSISTAGGVHVTACTYSSPSGVASDNADILMAVMQLLPLSHSEASLVYR